MKNNNLGIIAITYNSSFLIKQFIKNIDLSKNDLVIVDNASKDNTIEIIEKNFPQIKIIKNSYNSGFSRAANNGIKSLKNKYALLLNIDSFISQDDIDKIVNIMNSNNKIAIAGPMIYSGTISGNQILEKDLITRIALKEKNNKIHYNKFITGAAMFLNLKNIKNIGLFDENFFLYCEDNEICKRSIKKGYINAIISDTKLIHAGGGSCNILHEEIQRIYWHKFGWSKLYYTEKVHGKFIAKLKAIRMIIKFLITIFAKYFKNTKPKSDILQALNGSYAYLIGKNAFDNNNKARG